VCQKQSNRVLFCCKISWAQLGGSECCPCTAVDRWTFDLSGRSIAIGMMATRDDGQHSTLSMCEPSSPIC
jgi:hypothetical protein